MSPHSRTQAALRAQTGYYERHVLAWYALGRVREARAAWAAVSALRRRLADAELTHLRRS